MAHIIKYTYNDLNECFTSCPHMTETMAGSVWCRMDCPHNLSGYYDEDVVVCAYPFHKGEDDFIGDLRHIEEAINKINEG